MTLAWDDSTPDVNQEVTATLSFKNNDVRAVYIDWDDGTDSTGSFSNKKEYANFQWFQTTEPVSSTTLTHTYNASGVFYPVVQVVNSRGFVSRYYSDEASNTDVTPFSRDTGVVPITVSDIAATGIMRVENTTVDSGIDNSIFEREGPKSIYAIIPPILTQAELDYAGTINLEIELMVANSSTNVQITDGKMNSGYSTVIQKLALSITSATGNTGLLASGLGQGKSCAEVLSVTYKNPKITGTYANDYTRNAALNALKIFLVAISDDGEIYPITYVTPGCPYKSVDNVKRYITLDMSQSRAAASNISNKYYFYDEGKSFFSPNINRWGDVNGLLSSGKFTNSTRQTASTKTTFYTYNPRPQGIGAYATTGSTGEYTQPFGTGATDTTQKWYYDAPGTTERTNQFITDDFGRFFDTYHLVRNSVEPSSSATYTSSISGNQPTVVRITPILNFTTVNLATKFDITGTTGVKTANYTDAAFNNSPLNASGTVSLSGMNTQAYTDATQPGAETREANEYLLALWDSKTNKIFMQCTPWWSGSQYRAAETDVSGELTGLKIAGVSYLRATNPETINQNLEWVPLDFEDTTVASMEYRDTSNQQYVTYSSSFSKPGCISFDMPLDWSAIKMEDLYGGTMWTGATASDSYNPVGTGNQSDDVSGSYAVGEFLATSSATPLTSAYTVWGKVLTLTGAAISGAMDDIGDGTTSDVGAFKYMAELQSDGATGVRGQNLWVAKITGDGVTDYTSGWDGNDELYLHYGETTGSNYTEPAAGEVYRVIIKRINFYDVLPGNSKVNLSPAKQFNPVNAGYNSQFNNSYGFNDYTAGAALGLKTAWSGSAKYPLLISISGMTAAGVGSTDYYSPEIWNILDATEGFTTLVKEVDDSAYNLNPLSITSDIAMARGGNYYRAITRKGKVFIAKTGVSLSSIGFSSVALGDEKSTRLWTDGQSPSQPASMYGQLHIIRRLQSEAVQVYWDEAQKDGTFVRVWGLITNINETRGAGGPLAVVSYTFNLSVEEIALLDKNGSLMTRPFPLGGIEDEKSYS